MPLMNESRKSVGVGTKAILSRSNKAGRVFPSRWTMRLFLVGCALALPPTGSPTDEPRSLVALAERELDDLLYYIAHEDRRPATGERLYYQIKSLAESYGRADAPRHKYSDDTPGLF